MEHYRREKAAQELRDCHPSSLNSDLKQLGSYEILTHDIDAHSIGAAALLVLYIRYESPK